MRPLQGEAAEQARSGLANRGLKIARAEPYCLRGAAGGLTLIVVRVETEEGIIGWGGYTFDPHQIRIPETPGIGIDLTPEVLREYACDPLQADAEYFEQRMKATKGY
jgi:hypothetical protein